MLLGIAILNFPDRTLIAIQQLPIKEELQLTDTQLGLLPGTAFGLTYTLLGLPIGCLADATSRKWVLVGALATWTSLTAATGLARTFATLLVAGWV